MPKRKKPRVSQAVNIANGKTSLLVFQLDPGSRDIRITSIEDSENNQIPGFTFTLVPPSTPNAKRRIVRIRSNFVLVERPLVDPPTEGLLTISIDVTDSSSGTVVPITISDVPVEYVNDPAAP